MCIIMFRHHRHLHKINMKLFFTLTNVSQWYLVPHNCLQRNIDARYLIYVTKIKGSRVQAPIGKYLSLKDFRKSITTSISNIFLKKNHSWTIELTYPTGRKCRILEPSDFFMSRQNNGEWEFYRQISFSLLGNEHFSFTLLFVSLFLLFQFLITFKVQNRPNLFKILIVTS